jgi:hypothetical protein
MMNRQKITPVAKSPLMLMVDGDRRDQALAQ